MVKVTNLNSQDVAVVKDSQEAIDARNRKEKLRKAVRNVIAAWIIFGLLFCGGIVFLIYSGVRKEFRYNNWVKTEAVVVSQKVSEEYDKENNKTEHFYHAVFKYEFDGIEYSVADKTGSSSPIYKVGDTITIYVNPKNPKDFESQATTQFFFIFGSLMLIISFCALCFTTAPVLDIAFPKADWTDYVGRYLPFAIFAWSITILSGIMMKAHSAWNISALIIFIVALILSVFISIVMIKSIVENTMRRKITAQKVAEIDERLNELEEFKVQHPELFKGQSKDKMH
ncbi:MAG: DUF3592 domain-containing protein [Clostridia bacterium]|nr:DUF3592 domain-containing protein [Clostridia bacterium]